MGDSYEVFGWSEKGRGLRSATRPIEQDELKDCADLQLAVTLLEAMKWLEECVGQHKYRQKRNQELPKKHQHKRERDWQTALHNVKESIRRIANTIESRQRAKTSSGAYEYRSPATPPSWACSAEAFANALVKELDK